MVDSINIRGKFISLYTTCQSDIAFGDTYAMSKCDFDLLHLRHSINLIILLSIHCVRLMLKLYLSVEIYFDITIHHKRFQFYTILIINVIRIPIRIITNYAIDFNSSL